MGSTEEEHSERTSIARERRAERNQNPASYEPSPPSRAEKVRAESERMRWVAALRTTSPSQPFEGWAPPSPPQAAERGAQRESSAAPSWGAKPKTPYAACIIPPFFFCSEVKLSLVASITSWVSLLASSIYCPAAFSA